MDQIRCPKCGEKTDKKICPSCGGPVTARDIFGHTLRFATVAPVRTDDFLMQHATGRRLDKYVDGLLREAARYANVMNKTTDIEDFFLAYKNIMIILDHIEEGKIPMKGVSCAGNIRNINRKLVSQEKLLLDRAFRQAGEDPKKTALVFEQLCQNGSSFEPEAFAYAGELLGKRGLYQGLKQKGTPVSTKWRKKYG